MVLDRSLRSIVQHLCRSLDHMIVLDWPVSKVVHGPGGATLHGPAGEPPKTPLYSLEDRGKGRFPLRAKAPSRVMAGTGQDLLSALLLTPRHQQGIFFLGCVIFLYFLLQMVQRGKRLLAFSNACFFAHLGFALSSNCHVSSPTIDR